MTIRRSAVSLGRGLMLGVFVASAGVLIAHAAGWRKVLYFFGDPPLSVVGAICFVSVALSYWLDTFTRDDGTSDRGRHGS